jgi:hypothetical protein
MTSRWPIVVGVVAVIAAAFWWDSKVAAAHAGDGTQAQQPPSAEVR